MGGSAIQLQGLTKFYKYYDREIDRVKEIVTGRPRYRQTFALQNLTMEVRQGEVLGVVGKNGAGKSTLLNMLAGTVQPSSGQMTINGRVAALLELGASFHPEMTGHANVYLNAAILGLKKPEIDAIYEDIVNFSGIRDFMHRPVKTYSSGMFVRLAFSIAIQIDPDILIIDEALSVGDGVFARKSFDRIMDFKDAGKTILFCTHSLYQIEAICDRVLWLEKGQVRALGEPADIVTQYGDTLRDESPRDESPGEAAAEKSAGEGENTGGDYRRTPKIAAVEVRADGNKALAHHIISGKTQLEVLVSFSICEGLPPPSVAITITGGDGRVLTSVGTMNENPELKQIMGEQGQVTAVFPGFPLLKGKYNLNVYLMCEKGIHIYESVLQAAELNVTQQGLARGLFSLPHEWKS